MTEAGAVPQDPGVFARLFGVLVSPRQTFELIVARPRWFGAVAITAVVTAICVGAFLMTDIGQQAWLDQQIEASREFGGQMSDEQRAQQEQGLSMALPYLWLSSLAVLIALPIMTLIVAGLVYLIFNVMMGGEATYKQVLAVLAHGGVVSIIQQVFVTPLNYVRESLSSPTNLSIFLPMLSEGSFVMLLLGMIDLFHIWSLSLLAIGLGVLYRRKTSSTATTLFVIYGIILIAIAGVRTWMRG